MNWLGPEAYNAKIQITDDRLHAGAMYRLVNKYVAVQFIEYQGNTLNRVKTESRSPQHQLAESFLPAAFRR
jgi:hypothetical protein